MYEIYNDSVEVNDINQQNISVYVQKTKETFTIFYDDIKKNEPYLLTSLDMSNQLLFKTDIGNLGSIFLYSFENQLFLLQETDALATQEAPIFDVKINNQHKGVRLRKLGFSTLQVVGRNGEEIARFDDFFTERATSVSIDYKLDVKENKQILLPIAKAEYDKFYLIVTYNKTDQQIKIKKTLFERVLEHEHLRVNLSGHDKLSIKNMFNAQKMTFAYKEVQTTCPKKIFGKKALARFKGASLLGIYAINKERYYVYLKLNGLYVIKKRPGKATQFKVYLKTFILNKNTYIYGRLVHHAYNSFGKYEELYAIDEKHPLATFKRPFRRFKLLKQFGYFKVPLEKVDMGEKVHYPLFIGTKDYVLHKFPLGRKSQPSKNYSIKKAKDKIHVLRANIHNQATYSIVPYTKMYSLFNRFKIETAYHLSRWFYKNKAYNVNLYFEKQAAKADESGFRVFEKVKQEGPLHSKNYFILDEEAPTYDELKKKHGNSIIKRFSFKHYLSIFNADYFISSDLSNHVINDRIYNNKLMDKIKEVPLVFLQHGIMFAKPVENPLGKIFYKDYSAYNIYKNVVNSKLEAKEFYKMGYQDDDLLYSGLSTFDYAKLDKTSDKIVFMPTYRYWEEGMIYNGEIEKTTYFKSLIKIIKAFEKEGLRDKLMIVSHNKFSDYIKESMAEYQDVLGENPSEALKVARVFITDFSSAIYDAIYRGAYPIFYWEDKNYLTLKYEATPPVNEENAPGPIAWDPQEVVRLAKHAIQRNYETEDEFKAKYRNINAFGDNKNTERIVKFLKNDEIL